MSLEKDITYTDKNGKVWHLKYSIGDYVRSENGKLVNFKGSAAHLFDDDLEGVDGEIEEVICVHCDKNRVIK